MALLATPVISEGIIRFERPGRLRWQVDTPEPSVAVVDGKAVKISHGGKEREVSGVDRQAFLAISDLVEGIVSGDLLTGKSMHAVFYKSGSDLLVELTPTDPRMAKRIKQVFLLFAGSDHSLRELRMDQVNGDRTLTTFSNAEFGAKHPTTTFHLP